MNRLSLLALLACHSGPVVQLTLPARIQQGQTSARFNQLSGRLDVFFNVKAGQCSSITDKPLSTVDLDVSGPRLSAHIDVTQAGQYTVMVSLYDTRATGTKLVLLQACVPVSVQNGKSTLAELVFEDTDTGFDVDHDGVSNLDEILAGTDCEKSPRAFAKELAASISGGEMLALTDGGIVVNGMVNAQITSYFVGVFAADGTERWKRTDLLAPTVSVASNRVVAFVSGTPCKLIALNASDGTVLWQKAVVLNCAMSAAPDPATIQPDGSVWLVDSVNPGPGTGAHVALAKVTADGVTYTPYSVFADMTEQASAGMHWSTPGMLVFQSQSSALCAGAVGMCSALRFFDVAGPAPTETGHIDIAGSASPTLMGLQIASAAGGRVYWLQDHTLSAYDKTGNLVWSKPTNPTTTAPGPSGGTRFSGGASGASDPSASDRGPVVLASGDVLVRAGTSLVEFDVMGNEKKRTLVGNSGASSNTLEATVLADGRLASAGSYGIGYGTFVWATDGSPAFFFGDSSPASDIVAVNKRLYFLGSTGTAPQTPEAPTSGGALAPNSSSGAPKSWLIAVDLP